MKAGAIRILGLTARRIEVGEGRLMGKDAGLYTALNRRYNVVGILRPTVPKLIDYLNRFRHFHLDRSLWRWRAGLNPWLFRYQTARIEQQLQQWQGRYDLILQLHTLFAPGLYTDHRKYVLTTDNTYMLSERHYPGWNVMPNKRLRDEWVRRERVTYQQAAFLFPWSEFTRCSMIEDYGMPPERVVAVGAGVNLYAANLNRKRYDTNTALFVGTSFKLKGGLVLLQAWELVLRKLPQAQLWIVGTRRVVDSTLPGVRWFGKVKDRQALSRLYMQATVFVLPSLFDAWGHVFLEAMGHGLPCIGTNRCAMPEIIQDGVTGRIVPSAEVEPLADALVNLLADPAQAEKMGRQAHIKVLQDYTWDDVVARMSPYIEQAVWG